MEFFYVVKATQKSGKEDAVIWFTAKSEARANLQLDVELEEAGIETGRGKDYQKPVRTDFPVYNDLPDEITVDYSWCKRYELNEDQRTWKIKLLADDAQQNDAGKSDVVTGEDNSSVEVKPALLRPVSRLRLPQRLIAHLINDTEVKEITEEQHVQIGEMESDDSDRYIQNLLLAMPNVPGIKALSAHVEWSLVSALKLVFERDQEEHAVSSFEEFMNEWIETPESRTLTVHKWLYDERPETVKNEIEPSSGTPVLTTVVTLPLRQRILVQFIANEYAYHIDAEQKKAIQALELDVDNSYVQNMLLAAENVEPFKKASEIDIFRVITALKSIFPIEGKRVELSLVIQFFKTWFGTEHIDRGILVREWAAGNRIGCVQRTDSGTNADGGYVTDRGEVAHHTLDSLDLEIACATLPMDFNPHEIPGSVLRRAKEVIAKKEEPWKSWSKILRNQPGILAVNRAAIFNLMRIAPENIHLTPVAHLEFVNQTMTAAFNSAVELLPLPDTAMELVVNTVAESDQSPRTSFCTHEENLQRVREEGARRRAEDATKQSHVENLGRGVFSVDGLMNEKQPENDDRSSVKAETTSNVQMEKTNPEKGETVDAVQTGKSADDTHPQTDALTPAEVLAAAAPSLANQKQDNVKQKQENVHQNTQKVNQTESEAQSDEPAVVYPAYFEPGRYEGLPNEVYHAANGISSTQVKDARVSLMYFNARHVEKIITKERSPVLDMGNLVHALALQPELLDAEFSIEPVIPEGAFTTTATIRAFIDEYNASLPALLSADDIKALIEEYNATLSQQVALGSGLDETAQSYMALPAEFQRIEADQKQTATAMKACIKEYNATLPAQVKTSGSRDALLEQLALINPDLVAQEAQKAQPLKVSGTKADLMLVVKSVNPDAVFADELLDAWRDNPESKVLVTHQQLSTALAIQKALLDHPTAGKLLTHPSRAVEVSYFGFDEETGLEVRVRPDLEIDLDGVRIGADLKTISMWNIKQDGLRAKLHREIIDRDYHLSAAMYCETAALDQFFWIFVNKDENYHWIAIIEASEELLELGMLEYRKAMRAIATGFDTGEWPAPITADYTDELNDFDLRRLEALRTQA